MKKYRKKSVQVSQKQRQQQEQHQQPLELSIISAQDLKNVNRFGKVMKTYAVAWVNPTTKAWTHVDEEGGKNPTWNDKLLLSIDKRLFYEDTAVLTIDIFSQGTLKDIRVGTVRILLADAVKARYNNFPCVAFLIRRPSGRPQGILNISIPPSGRYPSRYESPIVGRYKSIRFREETAESGNGAHSGSIQRAN